MTFRKALVFACVGTGVTLLLGAGVILYADFVSAAYEQHPALGVGLMAIFLILAVAILIWSYSQLEQSLRS